MADTNFPPIKIGNIEINPQRDPLDWGHRTPVPGAKPVYGQPGLPLPGPDWPEGQEEE